MLPGWQSVRCRRRHRILRTGKDVDHRGGGCKAQTHNFAKFSFKGMKSGKFGPRGWGGGENTGTSAVSDNGCWSRLIGRGDLDLSFSFKKCWHKKKSIYWTGANTGFPRRRSVYCKEVGGPGCMKMKIGLSKGSIHTERKRKKSKKQLQTSWTDFAFASTFASV